MQMSPPSQKVSKRRLSALSPYKNSGEVSASTPIASATPTSKRLRYATENMYSPHPSNDRLADSPSVANEPHTSRSEEGGPTSKEENDEPGILNTLFSPVLKYLT